MPYVGSDPKSGCSFFDPAFKLARYASDLGSTGSPLTSRFQGLSAGNTVQLPMEPPPPGVPPPPLPPLPPLPPDDPPHAPHRLAEIPKRTTPSPRAPCVIL